MQKTAKIIRTFENQPYPGLVKVEQELRSTKQAHDFELIPIRDGDTEGCCLRVLAEADVRRVIFISGFSASNDNLLKFSLTSTELLKALMPGCELTVSE